MCPPSVQTLKSPSGIGLIQLGNILQSLTAEDSELRQRMNSAMSEMGGMASKLTDALKERDALKVEVD